RIISLKMLPVVIMKLFHSGTVKPCVTKFFHRKYFHTKQILKIKIMMGPKSK
ncbi:unnamed protein product, partial [Leptidea sinapis]